MMSLFRRTSDPVLVPTPDVPWAAGAVFNPGALRTADGVTHLVVRGIPAGYERHAVAEHDAYEGAHAFTDYVSTLGHATSRDGVTFTLDPTPLVAPTAPHDAFGAEDARLTEIDGTVYITYTALTEPAFGETDGVGIGLATTRDFRTVERHGRIGPPGVRDKDAVLFPRRIGGRFAMLHRIVPDIQIAWFEDEEQLRNPGEAYWQRYLDRLDMHVVMRPEHVWEGKKIGAGPPPIETPEGWLVLYHGADRTHVYRAGLALLDLDDPRRVVSRCAEPVFGPETTWETTGDVDNVVFPTGLTRDGDTLHVYYGAADRVVGHATASLSDALEMLAEARRTVWRMPFVSMRPAPRDGSYPGPLPRTPALPTERLNDGHPVLAPIPEHDWESHVVLNPAATLLDDPDVRARVLDAWPLTPEQRARLDSGAVAMLYRAQGTAFDRKGHKASSLGFALFTPELELVYRHPTPVIPPDDPEHDLGVEDPRCTRVGDTFYLYYTGYQSRPPSIPGHGVLEGRVQICLATSTDLATWTLHGPARGDLNDVPNKNAVLLPEPVDGRWVFLHRPLDGETPMAMHWATGPAPEGPWTSHGPLLVSKRFGDQALSWLGAAGPPESLGGGRFASLFHQGHVSFERRKLYHLSAMLLDFTHQNPLRACVEPVLMPTGDLETVGDPLLGVDNVVFSCANYRVGDDWIVPYAGADSRIFGARLSFPDVVEALEQAEAARQTAPSETVSS